MKVWLNFRQGKSMKQNVYSISQGNRKYLSFLSTAAGLMADLDLDTEHLRWMGDRRFIIGYLQGGEPPSPLPCGHACDAILIYM